MRPFTAVCAGFPAAARFDTMPAQAAVARQGSRTHVRLAEQMNPQRSRKTLQKSASSRANVTEITKITIAGIAVPIGDQVWCRDAEETASSGKVFTSAKLRSIQSDERCTLTIGPRTVTKKTNELLLANKSDVNPGDHCALVHMNEAHTATTAPVPAPHLARCACRRR